MDRQRISLKTLLTIWQKEEEAFLHEKLKPKVVIDQYNVQISDCEIFGELSQEERFILNKAKTLRLVNCEIQKIDLVGNNRCSIVLLNCQVHALHFTMSSYINQLFVGDSSKITELVFWGTNFESLFIADKSIVHNLKLTSSQYSGNILLENESTIDFITAEESVFKNLTIQSNSHLGTFWLNNKSKLTDIVVRESSIGGLAILHDSTINNFNSRGSKIDKFSGLNSQLNDIKVDKSQIIEVDFRQNCQLDEISISDSKIRYFQLDDVTIKRIAFERHSRIQLIEINYLKEGCRHLTIDDCKIEWLTLRLSKSILLNINNCKIWTLNFHEKVFPKDGILHIADCQLNKIRIESFLNQGTIFYTNVQPLVEDDILATNEHNQPIFNENSELTYIKSNSPASIIMSNSDLGKTSFIGSNLNKFDKFIFRNSKLLEVFIADTVLPKKEKIETIDNSVGRTLFEQRRLALGQFKKIYENRGDIANAIFYHAEEMETYRQCLGKSPRAETRTERWNMRGERFNLWLNKISSYYGNNWIKAFFVATLLNALLFCAYCLSLGFRLGSDTKLFWELTSYSFEFLNPLRKADFIKEMKGVNVNAVGRSIDYVSRVIIAYFVYQLIQSFRKFGRKSA